MLDAASQTETLGALLVRDSEREVLEVRGRERATWLNGVVTPDVGSLAAGRGVFGLLLSKQGKIQTDFWLAAASDRFLLAVAPGTGALAASELERMLVMEDAEVENVSGRLECLYLHGSRAVELASAAATRVGGVAAELDRTGLGGAVLFVEREAAGDCVVSLGADGAVLATPRDWLELRMTRGVGQFGVDYGPADNPHEASLERLAVSWNKGCYLGQEAVFMQDARGKLKRRSAWLAISGHAPPAGSPVLSAAGEAVGEVTSVADIPGGTRAHALARLKAPHFESGSHVTVAGLPAVVLERRV